VGVNRWQTTSFRLRLVFMCGTSELLFFLKAVKSDRSIFFSSDHSVEQQRLAKLGLSHLIVGSFSPFHPHVPVDPRHRIMKRPADQAKLLFFYLLRSSAAALATSSNEAEHICLRLARRTDVPALQRCNLATLPENYNTEFYSQHLRTWPDLALVAEHIVPGQKNVHLSFPGSQPEPNIVGYVLGKVEDRYIPYDPRTEPPLDGSVKTFKDLAGNTLKLEPTGHVTSLAVLHDYRRRGLAAALMNQLHVHLREIPWCISGWFARSTRQRSRHKAVPALRVPRPRSVGSLLCGW
jgi:ribosomal protein S18 acetylase RimI-like enzyme